MDTFDDIASCSLGGGVPGVIYGIPFCHCMSNTDSALEYCLPYIESPQDSSYPCSPKMLKMYEEERYKEIPHAFLGLTHTHPDKLDKQGDIEIEKYSNLQYDPFTGSYFNGIKKDRGKWHERVYPSILVSKDIA